MGEFAIEKLKAERAELARLLEQLPRTSHWARWAHLKNMAAINPRIAAFVLEQDVAK